jgi:galactofuranosylgalactofuranosylrhamnosyl-N-acetylglucosaminyl-diphospho-decaprenol beta-1,5/1,6-galactofuranosyltransferase
MNVVNRLKFPQSSEASSLYLKCNESANLSTDFTKINFGKNGLVSLNTYFNSFYETFYAQHTEIDSLYYTLNLEGDFEIFLYREEQAQNQRELISKNTFNNCKFGKQVTILLPDSWGSGEGSRVYLEIMCLSEQGSFTDGYLLTEKKPLREVSLGIITCTFKKEAFVKKTVDSILKDNYLQNKNLKVFIVDNGRTLKQDEFTSEKVELISNRNVGGSGGFTCGLIQALEQEVYTHFLFMDDDIELDSESIYRLFPLYEYAKQDFAIAGGMFDLYQKHVLYEAGARYGKTYSASGDYQDNPFEVISLTPNYNLEDSKNINLLLSDNPSK